MPQRILGIDIGAWSVKGVTVEAAFRNLKVVAAREVRIEPGEVETTRERTIAALTELMSAPELKTDLCIAALPGSEAATRQIELPFSDPKKVEQTIGGELADVLPFDIDDAVFDHSLIHKTALGGSRSVAAAALRPRVADRLSLLEEGGVNPKYLLVDAFQISALYSAYLADDGSAAEQPVEPAEDAHTFIQPTPDGPPEARMIVDIGHARTLVCACNDEGVAHARVLRAGGRDVTEALRRAFDSSPEELEALKHTHGFVASSRHPAPDDESQVVSEQVANGLKPLVRELRRTLQVIRKERRVHVGRIDLLGGGSKLRNLAPYLAEQLNVPVAQGVAVEQAVERNVEGPRRGAFSLALALALRPASAPQVPRIDLRVGEFAFSGQLEFFRRRLPFIGASALVLLLLLMVSIAAQYRSVVQREAQIDLAFCTITKEVVGQEICEPSRAISVMKTPASDLGTFRLPRHSAYEVSSEISDRVPKDLKISFSDIDVTPERARVDGQADSFESVDKLVASYAESPCLAEIKKSRIRKSSKGDGVEFQLSMQVTCS